MSNSITRLIITCAATLVAGAVAGAQQPTATSMPQQHTTKTVQQTTRRAHETQADLQKEAKITMDSAKTVAMKAVPGATIHSGEIEREGGHLIYSFDTRMTGRSGVEEVNVDAMTGRVLNKHHESAAAERKEAAQEHRDSTAMKKP